MKTVIKYLFAISISFCFVLPSSGQSLQDRTVLGEQYAKDELRKSLLDTTMHYKIKTDKEIIGDKETALNIAQPILYKTYGKKNILKQKPYEIYLIDNYWIISGTLPKESRGGTFFIIISATDSKIIRLSHGQ